MGKPGRAVQVVPPLVERKRCGRPSVRGFPPTIEDRGVKGLGRRGRDHYADAVAHGRSGQQPAVNCVHDVPPLVDSYMPLTAVFTVSCVSPA